MTGPIFIDNGALRWSEAPDDFIGPPWFGGVLNIRPGLAVAIGEGWLWQVRYDPSSPSISDSITVTKLMEMR